MTSMSTIYSIRKLRRDGDTIAEIARKTAARSSLSSQALTSREPALFLSASSRACV